MRVDFYVLTTDQVHNAWLVVARLIAKAYDANHNVFVLCNTAEDAQYLDELLWSFKPERLLPHQLQTITSVAPIQIGFGPEPKNFDDILINCSTYIPTFHKNFKRIIEVVLNTENAKAMNRKHYCDYRALGYELVVQSKIE